MKKIVAALLALLVVAGAETASAQSFEVVDAIGRHVKIAKPVERVVVNFNFEEFTAVAGVDGWKKVVGMSRSLWEGWRPAIFSKYVAVIPNLAAMPEIGNTEDGNFSAETVIGLRPDVVLMAEWGFQSMKTARDQIEAAGIPIVVIDYNAQLLERHLASTRALGKVMGKEARAEELAQLYERAYADIMARIAKASGPKRTIYVELGQAGAETIGNSYNGTMWGKIIPLLGAVNVADGKLPGPWGPLSAEAVIAADPDMILIAGSSWVNRPKAVKTGYDTVPETTRASLAPYAQRAGWQSIKAVRTGEVHAIEHGLARTLFDFVAMQYIAKQLYPAQFADIDPEASFRAYHAKYLPVAYSGTWMLKLAQ
jgi:ABC-type Fe3+-hydroxamate transport system substrate-binding protein